jgi:hypothetical protein
MTMMCIAGYAMSAAPVVWILCSEIQPLKCRDFGITCSTTTNWVSNMIIGATFLTLLDAIGAAGTFWLYTVLNVAFIGVTFWLIPETKGVTLEHIERKLMAGRSCGILACDRIACLCIPTYAGDNRFLFNKALNRAPFLLASVVLKEEINEKEG